jgi:arylsulfatase
VLSETRSDGKPAGYGTLKPKSITQSGIEGIASRHGYGVGSLGESLFDLDTDPGETQNLAPKQPEVIRKMKELAAGIRRELGDTLTATFGTEVRPAGRAP